MKYLLFGIALLFVIAGAALLFLKPHTESLRENAPQTATTEATATAAFSADGYLVRDAPGQKPGVWYLLFERPGEPALTLELLFASIPEPQLSVGQRVHVEGTASGTALSVRSIARVSASTSARP